MLNNRDIYEKDPSQRKLVNEGVANVNDNMTEQALRVLRYELETFVCDGRYREGLERILDTYLRNLGREQQPAVWVSGFFGSGKSHLVKMLRALWENTEFPDGKRARDLAELPDMIAEQLKELNTRGRRSGGLRAASGTLSSGTKDSVRLALLQIIFKAMGLPHKYFQARFVMWLKKEEILDAVREGVAAKGARWEEELEHFYVAKDLHGTLVEVRPQTFPSIEACSQILTAQYPNVQDISLEDMIYSIKLAMNSEDGIFPLTLIILDEVQQYIGESSERSLDVQEVVEACCKNIGSNLLFIGTGQTAVTGTANLKKLEGRFTVRVELSDTDVDAVIRKVVLAKKASARRNVDIILESNNGEIYRHLRDTSISHRKADDEVFIQDYPILPVRRRFWEQALRVLDQTGTESQLRNQLTMVHKAIQTNLDDPLGTLIGADYLYFDAADKLLQAHLLPRKIHERTIDWITKGNADERLMARATGLVFLINKLSATNKEVNIRANPETIADLLVEDLNQGSDALRSRLSSLLERCELLMLVEDEYRIQTEESTAWHDEYQNQRNYYGEQNPELEAERNARIKNKFNELISNKQLSVTQGSKGTATRKASLTFDSALSKDAVGQIVIWVRDGWSNEEQTVRNEAASFGNESPIISVFIPKRSADDLRTQLINYKATTSTLQRRGTPNTPEGNEARSAIETFQTHAEKRIGELLEEAFQAAKVFKGGGDGVVAADLSKAIQEAIQSSIQRLYPQFDPADEEGWNIVYNKASEGAPDALKRGLDYSGEPNKHPVCSQILRWIGAGKRGSEIRSHFENPPYGWTGDVVDGALLVLLNAQVLRATDEQGMAFVPKKVDRRIIAKLTFKSESIAITTPQRLAIRGLLQRLGIFAKGGEELANIPTFIQGFEELAQQAGGQEPLPVRPSTHLIEEVRLRGGNEQLLALYERCDALGELIDTWTATATLIQERLPDWKHLLELFACAKDLPDMADIEHEISAIQRDRLLLDTPNPIPHLGIELYNRLALALRTRHKDYQDTYMTLKEQLLSDPIWQQLTADQQHALLNSVQLQDSLPPLQINHSPELLEALKRDPLRTWDDRIGALQKRFENVRQQATRLLQPQAQTITLPRRTLQSPQELQAWLQEVEGLIGDALANGSVILT